MSVSNSIDSLHVIRLNWFDYLKLLENKYDKQFKIIANFTPTDRKEGITEKKQVKIGPFLFRVQKAHRQYQDCEEVRLDTINNNHWCVPNREDIESKSYSVFNEDTGEELFSYQSVWDNLANDYRASLVLFDQVILDTASGESNVDLLFSLLAELQKYPEFKV